MRFSVQHTTRYLYESPVRDSFNDAHLCPVSDDFQCCEAFDLIIEPKVSGVLRRLDFYTNQVHHFEVMEYHEALIVTAKSTVATFEDTRNYAQFSDPSLLPGLVADERYYDFLHQSDRVGLSTPVRHELSQLNLEGFDVKEQVEQIMAFIFESFQ